MRYTENDFTKHVNKWEKLLSDYKIPSWDELPSLDLYMDQVIVLMNRYLKVFDISDSKDAVLITPPMINNYVKLKAMPAPNKKKYSKMHLAYLIMISTLKNALSLPAISLLIPLCENEEDTKAVYDDFCVNQKKAFSYIKEQVGSVISSVLGKSENGFITTGMALQLAASANVFKILSDDAAKIGKNDDEDNSEK